MRIQIAALAALLEGAWALTCPGTFQSISAADYVGKLKPGWNLGNTLDAVPDEGSWNNAPVQASTFDVVKAAGFKSVRLPGQYSQACSYEKRMLTPSIQ
jgi:endoglucanase